jgi:hypothetical protein
MSYVAYRSHQMAFLRHDNRISEWLLHEHNQLQFVEIEYQAQGDAVETSKDYISPCIADRLNRFIQITGMMASESGVPVPASCSGSPMTVFLSNPSINTYIVTSFGFAAAAGQVLLGGTAVHLELWCALILLLTL